MPSLAPGLGETPTRWPPAEEKPTTLGLGGKYPDWCHGLVNISHGRAASLREKSTTLGAGGKCLDRRRGLVKIPHGHAASTREKSTTLPVGKKWRRLLCPRHWTRSSLAPRRISGQAVVVQCLAQHGLSLARVHMLSEDCTWAAPVHCLFQDISWLIGGSL